MTYILLQKPTASYKCCTFIDSDWPDVVTKGPYKAGSKALTNMLERTKSLAGVPHIYPPSHALVDGVTTRLEDAPSSGDVYLCWRRLGCYPKHTEPYRSSFVKLPKGKEIVLSKEEEDIRSDLESIELAGRCVTLSTLTKAPNRIPDLPASLLYALLKMRELGVGDVGTRNILVVYPESDSKLEGSRPEFFINDYEESFTAAPRTLKEYIGSKGGIIESMLSANLERFEDEFPWLKARHEIDYTKKLAMGGANTFHGFSNSLIKSAMQKNIRRGETQQAIYCGYELLRLFEFADKESGTIVISNHVNNMFNRLLIIAAEDVSPWSLNLLSRISRFVVPFTKSLTVRSKADPSYRFDLNKLGRQMATMIASLCAAPKSRVMSHLNNYHRDECAAFRCSQADLVSLATSDPSGCVGCWLNRKNDAFDAISRLIRHHNAHVFCLIRSLLEKKGGKRTTDKIFDVLAEMTATDLTDVRAACHHSKAKIRGQPQSRTFIWAAVCHIWFSNSSCEKSEELENDSYPIVSGDGYDLVGDIVIRPWMLDQHTNVAAASVAAEFRRVGAYVENQDPRTFDQAAFERYTA